MKIIGVQVIKFVVIDTDQGEFRVTAGGNVEVWNNDTLDYSTVYDWDYDDGVVEQLKKIAAKELE